jgi:hypothetical protein
MKRSKFSEEQIAYALKQNELGSTVEEVCLRLICQDGLVRTLTQYVTYRRDQL